jgi:hypothetical protein
MPLSMQFTRWRPVQIINVRKSRRCIDGTILREYTMDTQVSEGMIGYLEYFGTVKVLADMAQPFYTFRMGNYFSVKGMVGDTAMFVRFKPEFMPDTEIFFTRLISGVGLEDPGRDAIVKLQSDLIKKMISSSRESH